MITYLLLSCAAVYVLRKWLLFRKYDKNHPTYEQIDSDLIVELNTHNHMSGGS